VDGKGVKSKGIDCDYLESISIDFSYLVAAFSWEFVFIVMDMMISGFVMSARWHAREKNAAFSGAVRSGDQT
jgi:hypothetical protein